MKRKHLNLLLVVAALALVPAIYFSREKPKAPPKPLTDLAPAAITHVLIHHDGAADIELEKRNGEWWLTKPVHTRAEAIEVNGVLELASRSSDQRYPVAEVKLAELGLDKPGFYVDLNQLRISFGDLDPIEGRRYLRIGDMVDLAGDPPSAALDANYSDLVSKRLLPADAKIGRIQFRDFAVQRNAQTGGWQVEPKNADRGADAAQKLVNAWMSAQSMWNTATDKAAKSEDTVTIETDSGEIRFSVLDRKDQLVLGRPDLGVSFTLPKNLMQNLFELQAPAEAKTAPVEKARPRP